jgi:hypothetical protein
VIDANDTAMRQARRTQNLAIFLLGRPPHGISEPLPHVDRDDEANGQKLDYGPVVLSEEDASAFGRDIFQICRK